MDFVTYVQSWTNQLLSFHFSRPLCPQKNNEMSNELVVEGENSAPMSEVCPRTPMDAIEELQEEEEEEQE